MTDELKSAIARALRAWTGLDQKSVAKAIGVSDPVVIDVEKGRGASEKSWAKLMAFYSERGLYWRGGESGEPGCIIVR